MNPNVEMIRAEGVRVIGRIPFIGIRQALRAVVKVGELGHLPKSKDGFAPEVYFHPDKKIEAKEMRKQIALEAIGRFSKIVVGGATA